MKNKALVDRTYVQADHRSSQKVAHKDRNRVGAAPVMSIRRRRNLLKQPDVDEQLCARSAVDQRIEQQKKDHAQRQAAAGCFFIFRLGQTLFLPLLNRHFRQAKNRAALVITCDRDLKPP